MSWEENNSVSGEAGEDRLVHRLMDRLNDHTLPSVASFDDETDEMLRVYVEVLGFLPYDLEPLTPAAAVKQKVMAAVLGRAQGAQDDQYPAEVVEIPVPRWSRWALPVAATLAIALLGISFWQFNHLEQQRTTIERLAGQLTEANRQSIEVAEFQRELERARNKLELVTSRGVEVCTLHPMEEAAPETAPRGTLFVAADHQHWYLRIDDLEPCPQGRAYQLWFMKADGTAVNGGILEVTSGVGLEVTSDEMPVGTVAVSITLEPAGGSQAPSGPSVLYGDEVMRIL